MSFDGVATYAAVKELKDNLFMGKIEKIYQPQPEQLLFIIHTKNGKRKLFMSSGSNHSAVYLVDETPENPQNPPVFCMVLRKHLGAARITDVLQHENDRIIEILMETVNELGFSVNKKLVIEIMGKHSNIMLVDMDTGRIIDSIKHVSIDVNRARQILPGKQYEYPPAQDKIPFCSVTENDMEAMLAGQSQPERSLLNNIQGISPALAESIALCGDPASCYARLRQIIAAIDDGAATPVVYIDEDDKPLDFHVTALAALDGSCRRLDFDSFSAAAGYFFRHRETSNTVKQKANDLLRHINGHLSKLRLKTQRLNEDLRKAQNSDRYRLYGELLTANLHAAKPGDTSVQVTNYYDGTAVDITLDPRFSPAKNAQNYYKKYSKAKTAIKEKQIQLEETYRQIAYLESVAAYAERARTVEETELLRQELTDAGFIRYRKTRSGQQKKSKPQPLKYTLSSGKTVLVGRNNRENDWLTLKRAASSDLWFHTKDIPGSHTVLLLDGGEPEEEDLFEAASVAAYHSKGRDSENVPVDYTKIRYVKKPGGANPGMVIFTHNRTLYVDPKLPE